jgi:hypothetical protein
MTETETPGVTTGQSESETTNEPWYTRRRGIVIIGFYAVLTAFAGLIAMGYTDPVLVEESSYYQENPIAIPPYIYVYAFMGAMAYVFTTLLVNVDADTKTIARIGLRVPAALLLVTGVYLLGSMLELVPGTPAEKAGLAFLVGLFVKHALKGLSTISMRMYPGEPKELFRERPGT